MAGVPNLMSLRRAEGAHPVRIKRAGKVFRHEPIRLQFLEMRVAVADAVRHQPYVVVVRSAREGDQQHFVAYR